MINRKFDMHKKCDIIPISSKHKYTVGEKFDTNKQKLNTVI